MISSYACFIFFFYVKTVIKTHFHDCSMWKLMRFWFSEAGSLSLFALKAYEEQTFLFVLLIAWITIFTCLIWTTRLKDAVMKNVHSCFRSFILQFLFVLE